MGLDFSSCVTVTIQFSPEKNSFQSNKPARLVWIVMKTKWLKEMSERNRKVQFFCGGFGRKECVKRSGSDSKGLKKKKKGGVDLHLEKNSEEIKKATELPTERERK